MTDTTYTCFRCGKCLRSAVPDDPWFVQPIGGTEFVGEHTYGSGLDGETTKVILCDGCVLSGRDRIVSGVLFPGAAPAMLSEDERASLFSWVLGERDDVDKDVVRRLMLALHESERQHHETRAKWHDAERRSLQWRKKCASPLPQAELDDLRRREFAVMIPTDAARIWEHVDATEKAYERIEAEGHYGSWVHWLTLLAKHDPSVLPAEAVRVLSGEWERRFGCEGQ